METADIFWPPEGIEINGYFFSDPQETTDFWARKNNCELNPAPVQLEDKTPEDSSTVTLFNYSSCDEDVEVMYYRIENGGHTWPSGSFPGGSWPEFLGHVNRDVNANAEIWNFFIRKHTGYCKHLDRSAKGLLRNRCCTFTPILFQIAL